MFKGAIFDLDGVVVNTVPLHFKAWKKMFAEYDIDFTFEMYKAKVDGIPREDGARAILKDLSDKELEVAAHRKQLYFLDLISDEGVEPYKSSIRLIKELREHGVKIAVISSSKNCRRIVEAINIGDLVDAIVQGGEFKTGKPHPEVFQLAAKDLGLATNDCVVIEDAVLGVEGAKNGKMLCVGVDRYKDPERLKKADLVIEDLSELNYNILKELF